MRKVLLLALLCLAFAGCKKKNAATKYAESLKEDVAKAKEAADKASAAVAEQNAQAEAARKASQ